LTNANPSIDPSNIDSITGLLRHVMNKSMQSMDGMLPAQVIAFSRNDPNRVQVQPLIMLMDTNGAQIKRGQIASIPVLQLGGGGFVLSFNLKPGDLGWIKANDRDISIFLQSYKESSPNTYRKKDFSDSLFIPDVMKGYSVDAEDLENAVIRSIDGTVKISFGTDKVKIKAPNVEIESTDATINCSNQLNISSTVGITATTPLFRVDGQINASGNITPNVP
jgi:hypothetical protein